jgi:hypothetical protein
LAEKIDTILPTILSSCQAVEVPRIDDESLLKPSKINLKFRMKN